MSLGGISQEKIFQAFVDRSTALVDRSTGAKRRSVRKRLLSYISRKRTKPQYRLNDHLPISPLLMNIGNIASQKTVPITFIPTYKPKITEFNTFRPHPARSTVPNSLEQHFTNAETLQREPDSKMSNEEEYLAKSTTTSPRYVKTTNISPTSTITDRSSTSTTEATTPSHPKTTTVSPIPTVTKQSSTSTTKTTFRSTIHPKTATSQTSTVSNRSSTSTTKTASRSTIHPQAIATSPTSTVPHQSSTPTTKTATRSTLRLQSTTISPTSTASDRSSTTITKTTPRSTIHPKTTGASPTSIVPSQSSTSTTTTTTQNTIHPKTTTTSSTSTVPNPSSTSTIRTTSRSTINPPPTITTMDTKSVPSTPTITIPPTPTTLGQSEASQNPTITSDLETSTPTVTLPITNLPTIPEQSTTSGAEGTSQPTTNSSTTDPQTFPCTPIVTFPITTIPPAPRVPNQSDTSTATTTQSTILPQTAPKAPPAETESPAVSSTTKSPKSTQESLVRHIHPCACDIPQKVMRNVDERDATRKKVRAELEKRLARVREVINVLRDRKLDEQQEVKESSGSSSSGGRTSEWSLFLSEGVTRRLKKTKIKVTTKGDDSKTKKGRRKKFPRMTTPSQERASRRRIRTSSRKPVRSPRKRIERRGSTKTPPRPKNPKVLAIIDKLSPKKTRSRVRNEKKLNLNWRKNPLLPVIDTRTSSMRKLEQSNTYCGRQLRTRTDSSRTSPSPPNETFKNTYHQVRIPVQQTRSSMLRIQAAVSKRKLWEAKQHVPTKKRPPFDVGDGLSKYT